MPGDPSEEYKDLSDNMRHYANTRFAQLTLYFALTAALINAVFLTEPPLASRLRLGLKIAGAIAAALFGVMEKRAADYWHHFRKRATALESILGYKQYTERPEVKVLSATNASRLLVWGAVPAWLAAVFCDL